MDPQTLTIQLLFLNPEQISSGASFQKLKLVIIDNLYFMDDKTRLPIAPNTILYGTLPQQIDSRDSKYL